MRHPFPFYIIYTNPKWDSYLFFIRIMLSLCSTISFTFSLSLWSGFSLYPRIKLKLILHYPTYFTIVSLISYDGLDDTSCSSSCNTAVAQRLARGAHNSEVTRSKRVSGIILFACFIEARRHLLCDVKHCMHTYIHTLTGVAQRQRAGLITPRTQDQSLSPVLYPLPVLQKLGCSW